MQKTINVLAIGGFLLALANSGIFVFAAVRGPAMAQKAVSEIEVRLTTMLFDKIESSVTDAMPGQVKELMPSQTGPAIPF